MQLSCLPALVDNYIWMLADDAGRDLVVDPGQAAPVLDASRKGLHPIGILVTHHHPDHTGGIADLLQTRPDLPVITPVDNRIALATRRVAEGDEVELAGWSFRVREIPGYTLSHIAFEGHGLLFCGDTLFSLGCGRLFEGSPAQMYGSLKQLAALPPDTRICCGHCLG